MGLRRQYEDHELIAILISKGRYYTIPEWKELTDVPSVQLYYRRFGTWAEAWRQAGYQVNSVPRNKKIYSDEDLINILKEKDRYYSKREWEELNHSPSYQLFILRFGNWENAWSKAGYELGDIMIYKRYKKQDIINKAIEIGRFMPPSEWKKYRLSPAPQTIINLFGSWDELFIEAGLDNRDGKDLVSNKNWNTLSKEEQEMLLLHRNRVPYRSIGELYGKTGEAIRIKIKKAFKKLEQ